LRALEPGGDAAKEDPEGEPARLVLLVEQRRVEDLPGLADAPVVERGAGAGAEEEAGEVEPARLHLGRLGAGGLALVDRVREGAREPRAPLVAARGGQALQLLHQRSGGRLAATERAPDELLQLLDVLGELDGGRGGAAGAEVEREPEARAARR